MDLYAFDDEYVRRLREDDPWTVRHFVSYFTSLFRIKLQAKLSADAVQDVTQIVFLRVLMAVKASSIRDGHAFGSYVNSVCDNVYHESVRKEGRMDPLDAKHLEVPSPDPQPDAMAIDHETVDRIARTLSELEKESPRDARMLRDHYLKDVPREDLCRQYEVDSQYLRVLLHRARKLFRGLYKEDVRDFRHPDETE